MKGCKTEEKFLFTLWKLSSTQSTPPPLGGVPPYISFIGMCPHKGYGFSRLFGLKTGTEFAHFGLETGVVFGGTTGLYELFIVSIPTE